MILHSQYFTRFSFLHKIDVKMFCNCNEIVYPNNEIAEIINMYPTLHILSATSENRNFPTLRTV